jgi:hypothetical protein
MGLGGAFLRDVTRSARYRIASALCPRFLSYSPYGEEAADHHRSRRARRKHDARIETAIPARAYTCL